jgi:hypothetical protein
MANSPNKRSLPRASSSTEPMGESIAPGLSISEHALLFCIAGGTEWQKAGVTGETVTAMVVRGLVDRDPAARLTTSSKTGVAYEYGFRQPVAAALDRGHERFGGSTPAG